MLPNVVESVLEVEQVSVSESESWEIVALRLVSPADCIVFVFCPRDFSFSFPGGIYGIAPRH